MELSKEQLDTLIESTEHSIKRLSKNKCNQWKVDKLIDVLEVLKKGRQNQ